MRKSEKSHVGKAKRAFGETSRNCGTRNIINLAKMTGPHYTTKMNGQGGNPIEWVVLNQDRSAAIPEKCKRGHVQPNIGIADMLNGCQSLRLRKISNGISNITYDSDMHYRECKCYIQEWILSMLGIKQ